MSTGFHRPSTKGTLHNSNSSHVNGTHPGLTAQPQNVKSANVYVFGDNDIDQDEVTEFDAYEMSELRARGPKVRRQTEAESEKPLVFEKPVLEGDTLQNVALKYGCQVAELRRLNKLMNDNGFFALKTIKIPVKQHGLLTELIQEEISSVPLGGATNRASNGPLVVESEDEDSDSSETRQLLVRTLSIRDTLGGSQSAQASAFLNKMDRDIKSIVDNTKNRKDTLQEVASSLTCKRIQPLHPISTVLRGADCGMRWWSLVLVMLVVGLLTPLLYLLYYQYGKHHN